MAGWASSPSSGDVARARRWPPDDELPALLSLHAAAATSGRAAVAVTSAEVFSTGMALNIRVIFRSERDAGRLQLDLHNLMRHAAPGDGLRIRASHAPDRRLILLHAGGSALTWQLRYWHAPLPPGDCELTIEWPHAAIALTSCPIASARIRRALPDVRRPWPLAER
jgi:hypothetical protein